MKTLQDMEAAVYLRKSRAEDGMDTDTILKRHRDTLTEYAAREGIHIIKTYPEVRSGESLYSRPEMLRLLEDVEAGKYDAVLCMDMDRLSRGSMRDQGIILDTFKFSHTLIVTPDKVYDLSVETDEQYAELKTFISRQEYKAITKRMQRGRMRSIHEGNYIAKAPFGYRNIHVGKNPTLEVYEPEAVFVRLIFQMAESGVGGTTIARKINDMGARTKTGGLFERYSINSILKNPVYIGKIPWNRQIGIKSRDKKHWHRTPRNEWLVTDGIHPAIIKQEQFDAVQEILQKRHSGPHFDGTILNPLAGIVRCEKCGGLMQRQFSHGPGEWKALYLHCVVPGCCGGTRLEYVENALIVALEEILDNITVEPDRAAQSAAEAQETALQAVTAELAKLEKAKSRLYELVEAGAYSTEEFRERMTATKSRITALEQERTSIETAIAERRSPEQQAAALRTALDAYKDADAATRNRLLKSVVKTVWYQKEKKTRPLDFTLRVELL